MHPALRTPRSQFLIVVTDQLYAYLPELTVDVEVVGVKSERHIPTEYDSRRNAFVVQTDEEYVSVTVACAGFETQRRRIRCHSVSRKHHFVLGVPGSSYAFMAGIPQPYDGHEDEIAIIYYDSPGDEPDVLTERGIPTGIRITDIHQRPRSNHSRHDSERKGGIFRADPYDRIRFGRADSPMGANAGVRGQNALQEAITAFSASSRVSAVGLLYRAVGEGVSIFTGRVAIRFFPVITGPQGRGVCL